jgi:hypothetical protein
MFYLLLVGRKKERKKKKKETAGGLFSPGLDMLFWLCCAGFLQLLGATKGQSLNFICT